MTLKNTKLVLGIATAVFALTGTVVSTEAAAAKKKAKVCYNKKGKKVKCAKKVKKAKRVVSRKYVEPGYVAPIAAPAPVAYDDSALRAKLADQDAKIAKLEAQPVEAVSKSGDKDNMVFFRGGYSRMDQKRDGVSIYSNAVGGVLGGPAYSGHHPDRDAWYFGAGLDFSVDDNLFGLMDKTELLGEIMFEYKELSNNTRGNALAANYSTNNGQALNPPAWRNVNVSMFTLTASPKIKFMKGSDFRPWLIPIGFSMNVVSPPSESITVLQPAMMFGGGADYRVWKNVYLGADVRYHWAPQRIDGVNTNGLTAGGYVGLGF